MNKLLQYALTVALLCFCSSRVMAQNLNQIACQNATSLTNLNSSLAGEWYEVSRSPASTLGCVNLNIQINSSGLNFTLTSASSVGTTYQNQSTTYEAVNSTLTPSTYTSPVVNATSPPGGFVYFPTANTNITVKVLVTDFSNYALICGYSNVTQSSFGAILTRQRVVSNANLTTYATLGNNSYADFANLTNVTQNVACYQQKQNSAASHVSVLSLIFATFYVMLNLIN